MTLEFGYVARMTSSLAHHKVRRVAVFAAVLACLLLGPVGAFALCLGGDGHIAVEVLSHGNHGSLGDTVKDDIARSFEVLEAGDRPCVDIPFFQNAKSERPSIGLGGAGQPVAALVTATPPTGPPVAASQHPQPQVTISLSLEQRRTVVLLN